MSPLYRGLLRVVFIHLIFPAVLSISAAGLSRAVIKCENSRVLRQNIAARGLRLLCDSRTKTLKVLYSAQQALCVTGGYRGKPDAGVMATAAHLYKRI